MFELLSERILFDFLLKNFTFYYFFFDKFDFKCNSVKMCLFSSY